MSPPREWEPGDPIPDLNDRARPYVFPPIDDLVGGALTADFVMDGELDLDWEISL